MSLKKVEQVKADKGFKVLDLIIYAAIAAIVAALIIVLAVTRDKNPLQGIRIRVENRVVFECNFDEGTYGALTDDGTITYEEPKNGEILIVTVHTESGYNVVRIDLEQRIVRVTDADCRRNDCIYSTLNPTAQIKDNNSMIYCLPHAVMIEPLEYVPNFDTPDFKV